MFACIVMFVHVCVDIVITICQIKQKKYTKGLPRISLNSVSSAMYGVRVLCNTKTFTDSVYSTYKTNFIWFHVQSGVVTTDVIFA